MSIPCTVFPPYARYSLFQGAVHVYSVPATRPADGLSPAESKETEVEEEEEEEEEEEDGRITRVCLLRCPLLGLVGIRCILDQEPR